MLVKRKPIFKIHIKNLIHFLLWIHYLSKVLKLVLKIVKLCRTMFSQLIHLVSFIDYFLEIKNFDTQRVGNYLPFRPFVLALYIAIYKFAKFLMQFLKPSTTIEFTELKNALVSNLISECNRSSRRKCSVRKGVLRNYAKFTGKHLCQSLFLIKLQAWDLIEYDPLFTTLPQNKDIAICANKNQKQCKVDISRKFWPAWFT